MWGWCMCHHFIAVKLKMNTECISGSNHLEWNISDKQMKWNKLEYRKPSRIF